MTRARRGVAGAAAILFVALLAVVARPTQACAHASLIRAVPADGAVVPRAPSALTLTFNEPISPLAIRLIGPDSVAIAPAAIVAENAMLTITPPPSLQRGTHVLSWRVISADGHPVGGSLLFSIGAPSGQPAAAAEHSGDRRVRAAIWAAKLAIYLGLFAGIGGAFFLAWIARPAARTKGHSIAALIAVALIAMPVSVALQGLDALELPLSGLRQRAPWEAGLATSYGETAMVAAFALLAGLFALVTPSARTGRALSLAGLIGAGLALALSGHASTAEPQLLSRAAVFVHALCVAFWIGALLPLLVAVRRSSNSTRGGAVLKRFSRAIVPVLVLLLASGVWLAVVQLGRVDALWSTSYGRVLSCKLAFVALLLGLGAVNRYRLVPKFERAGAAAARPLATAIAVEFAIAVVILGLVALWRFTPPPRALAAAAPISIHVHGDKAMAEIEIERQRGAPVRASVLVLDGAFQPFAVKEVTLGLANPAAGIEPLRLKATPIGENRWRIDDLRIPVAGRWKLEVDLLVSDFDKVTIEDTVTLPRVP